MKRSLTLVIAVYNAVAYLEFIFAALRRQSFAAFEVIVADDGSGPAMRTLVERAARTLPFPVRHLWQEDLGFRKNKMLNQAIAAAETDYLVFIDGDCVPHRDFLSDHAGSMVPGALLSGRRVNWSSEITGSMTLERVESGYFERLSLPILMDGLRARSANLEDGIRIKSPLVRKILHRNRPRILGCNFSVERGLLERVNGFNEDYTAPGLGEDSDIAFRLQLTGVNLITLRYLAILFHLYHPATKVGESNKRLYEETVAKREPYCQNGLRKPGSHG
jgi:glycosyltransferase involved in cell wall biosynthesis